MNAARRLIELADSRPQTPADKEQNDQEKYILKILAGMLGKDIIQLALEKKRQMSLAELKHACQIGADGTEASVEEDLQRITAAKKLLASL